MSVSDVADGDRPLRRVSSGVVPLEALRRGDDGELGSELPLTYSPERVAPSPETNLTTMTASIGSVVADHSETENVGTAPQRSVATLGGAADVPSDEEKSFAAVGLSVNGTDLPRGFVAAGGTRPLTASTFCLGATKVVHPSAR